HLGSLPERHRPGGARRSAVCAGPPDRGRLTRHPAARLEGPAHFPARPQTSPSSPSGPRSFAHPHGADSLWPVRHLPVAGLWRVRARERTGRGSLAQRGEPLARHASRAIALLTRPRGSLDGRVATLVAPRGLTANRGAGFPPAPPAATAPPPSSGDRENPAARP